MQIEPAVLVNAVVAVVSTILTLIGQKALRASSARKKAAEAADQEANSAEKIKEISVSLLKPMEDQIKRLAARVDELEKMLKESQAREIGLEHERVRLSDENAQLRQRVSALEAEVDSLKAAKP